MRKSSAEQARKSLTRGTKRQPYPDPESDAWLVALTKGFTAKISAEDVAWVRLHNWCYRGEYATRTIHFFEGGYRNASSVALHKEVFKAFESEIPAGYFVDHINGDKLDCRRSNLRLATPTQNQGNRRLSKNNTTGAQGVVRVVRKNGDVKFGARIQFAGRFTHLGFFSSIEEAAAVYSAAADEYFGPEFRCRG